MKTWHGGEGRVYFIDKAWQPRSQSLPEAKAARLVVLRDLEKDLERQLASVRAEMRGLAK